MLASSSAQLLLRPPCQQHPGSTSQPPNRSWQVMGTEEMQRTPKPSEGQAEGGLCWAATMEALNTRSITPWTPTAIYTSWLEVIPQESRGRGEAAFICLAGNTTQDLCTDVWLGPMPSLAHPPRLDCTVSIHCINAHWYISSTRSEELTVTEPWAESTLPVSAHSIFTKTQECYHSQLNMGKLGL